MSVRIPYLPHPPKRLACECRIRHSCPPAQKCGSNLACSNAHRGVARWREGPLKLPGRSPLFDDFSPDPFPRTYGSRQGDRGPDFPPPPLPLRRLTCVWGRSGKNRYAFGKHGKRQLSRHTGNYLTKLVGTAGLEPATPCSQGKCATRLRYVPTLLKNIPTRTPRWFSAPR